MDDRSMRIHQQLLTDISDIVEPNSAEYNSFVEHMKIHVPKGILSGYPTLLGKLQAMATKGNLSSGQYTKLKEVARHSGNIEILEIIQKAESQINELLSENRGALTGRTPVGKSSLKRPRTQGTENDVRRMTTVVEVKLTQDLSSTQQNAALEAGMHRLNVQPKPKKQKPERKPEPEKPKEEKKSEKPKASKSASGEYKFQLSKMRFVTVNEFRGKAMVGIREFYEADGELKPGRKGISFSMDQWQKLKSYIGDIDDAVDELA